MAELIARVRELIDDPSGAGAAFTDQAVQDALDRRRCDVRYEELRAEPTFGPAFSYLDYYAEMADWESDAQLVNMSYQPVTVATADYLTGHWVLASSQYPPVWIVGKSYDIYGSAADLLEKRIAKVAMEYDVTTAGTVMMRSQRAAGLRALATDYRSKQRSVVTSVSRTDLEGEAHASDPLAPRGIDRVARG